MRGYQAGENGPSYYDVERYLERLLAVWGAKVLFTVTNNPHGAAGQRAWWVRAEVTVMKGKADSEVIAGGCGLRGNGGAATITAAFWRALLVLEEALEERASRSEQQALF